MTSSYTKCVECGGANSMNAMAHDGGAVSETATRCHTCHHVDYWAQGYWQSRSEPPEKKSPVYWVRYSYRAKTNQGGLTCGEVSKLVSSADLMEWQRGVALITTEFHIHDIKLVDTNKV